MTTSSEYWWSYRTNEQALVHKYSDERIEYQSHKQDGLPQTGPDRWLRLEYRCKSDGAWYPLLVQIRRCSPGETDPTASIFRRTWFRPQLDIWRVDHTRSLALWRSETGRADLPSYGLWRRADLAVIQAARCPTPDGIVFGVRSAEMVALNGGWLNGRWRAEFYRQAYHADRFLKYDEECVGKDRSGRPFNFAESLRAHGGAELVAIPYYLMPLDTPCPHWVSEDFRELWLDELSQGADAPLQNLRSGGRNGNGLRSNLTGELLRPVAIMPQSYADRPPMTTHGLLYRGKGLAFVVHSIATFNGAVIEQWKVKPWAVVAEGIIARRSRSRSLRSHSVAYEDMTKVAEMDPLCVSRTESGVDLPHGVCLALEEMHLHAFLPSVGFSTLEVARSDRHLWWDQSRRLGAFGAIQIWGRADPLGVPFVQARMKLKPDSMPDSMSWRGVFHD
jgi:hypothetical protein